MHRYGECLFSRTSVDNPRIREKLLFWQRGLADSQSRVCFTTNGAKLQTDEVIFSVSYSLPSHFNDFTLRLFFFVP